MAHPTKGYWLGDERLPGTTTVIGRFKDSGGLLQWAFKQGQAGKSHLYEEANKACDIGTAAHAAIEEHINGGEPELKIHELLESSEDRRKALNAFHMYLKWESQTKLKLLSKFQEIQLVSPEYKFGGTPDAIGEIDGEIVLLDWKTSNGVYQDYIIQLAAYKHLVEDGMRMDDGKSLNMKVTGGAHLCRFSKEFADFDHRYYSDLSDAWEQFELFRRAYDIDKRLKKRAA